MSGGEESLLLDENVLWYCALFPKNHTIRRKELIEHLIDEEIIGEKDSRRAEFQSGHDILNILVTRGHVERCEDLEGLQYVKMRDEIRDEVIRISRRTQLVEAGRRLEAIPNVEKWTSGLLRVSLMHNDILEVPSSHTGIKCSDLSTLLLGNNNLERIADGFLGQFKKLKVLDLSMTNIQTLPEDVGSLKNLTALLLCGCGQLSRVPCLGNLESLKKLDLKGTGLENMPGGVELLRSLKYLDIYISNNEIKEIPSETLSKLSCLQVLKLNEIGNVCPTVEGAEVRSLRKLETLECNFKNLSDFSTYWNHQEGKELLREYSFLIGKVNWPDEFDIYHFSQSAKRVGMFHCLSESEDENVYLPTDVQMLLLEKCHELEDLDNLPALKSATELSDLFLIECEAIVGLIPSSWFSKKWLRSLQFLQLVALGKLTDLIVRRSDSSSPTTSLQTDSTFSQLTRIAVQSCDAMKKLFPRSLVPCLQNLETIIVQSCDIMEEIFAMDDVEHCDIMEEIFATDEEGSEVSSSSSYYQSRGLSLPKLKTLVLKRLPKLTSICKEVLRCPLVKIEVVECGKIEINIEVIEASNPRESWEPMECGDSNY